MNTESPRDSAVNRDHLNRFRTKPASLRELIWSFLSTTPDLMQELERCCQRRDQENAKNLLHTLTGAALSTGATSLAERCRHLACDWERSSSPTALSLQTLQAEVENTQNALRHFMDELAEGETSLVPAARPITLLLVEDNASARALVRLVLENDRFAILEATNGREALALAERESPDLAIVDLNLARPDQNRLRASISCNG